MHENSTIDALAGQAYGGSTAAFVPGNTVAGQRLPTSDPPPGVKRACDVLTEAICGGEPRSKPVWVFLIGGPGNGKSHQIDQVLRDLNLSWPEPDTENQPAMRAHTFQCAHSDLLIVNDATIGFDRAMCPMANDLREAWSLSSNEHPRHVLVNVNRGILVEEIQAINSNDSDGHEWLEEFLRWIAGSEFEQPARWVQESITTDFYRQGELGKPDDASVQVHCVYLDQLSLLECNPLVENVASGAELQDLEDAQYTLMDFTSEKRLQTPAARLLEALVHENRFERGECNGCPAQGWCPFLANAANLRDDQCRRGVLSIFRAAELETGALFTYRDLWSSFVMALAGNTREFSNYPHPCHWVQTEAKDATERPETAASLFGSRFFVSLFAQGAWMSVSDQGSPHRGQVSPAFEKMRRVDPSRDAIADWARPVNDAMSAVRYGELPHRALQEYDSNVASMITGLDAAVLDQQLSPLLGEDMDAEAVDRVAVLRSVGECLYRLYGLYYGIPSDRFELQALIQLRRQLERGARTAPQAKLMSGVKQLLFPALEDIGEAGTSYLPIFSPRVDPIRTALDQPIWCYAIPVGQAVRWIAEPKGDEVWLVLKSTDGEDRTIAEFQLDFLLCREAMACLEKGTGQRVAVGFTDDGVRIDARLERIRASFLGSRAGGDVVGNPALVHSDVDRVYVGLWDHGG